MTEESILRPDALALVTGAGTGIGAAVAAGLIDRGCRVIAAGRRLERLRELAARLGERCFPLELDITSAAATAGLLGRLPEDLKAIDILVNNAGHDGGGRRRYDHGASDDVASTVETGVIGTMRVTHAVAPGMVERGRGHIVNIGSVAGIQAMPGGAAYIAAKHGVHGFSRALRADYAGKGVRVSEILPGLTRTEFAEARLRGDKEKAAAFYENFDVVMEPEDVARAVLFALEQPPHVTIAELLVVPSG